MELITTLHEAGCQHTHDRTPTPSTNDPYGMEVSLFDEKIIIGSKQPRNIDQFPKCIDFQTINLVP